MAKIGQHVVVLGASMAGLLAARVLADFYETVTVVDRDELGDDPVPRRGVPQGRHIHVLATGGSQVMGELFPGMLEELAAAGVPVWDDGDLSKLDLSISGHRLARRGSVPGGQLTAIYYPSRPFLECHVRRRLRAVENVTFLTGHDAAELTSTPQHDRVTGVRLVSRDGQGMTLAADLVIDSTGRGSRMPVFLDNMGYGRPREDEVVIRLVYVSQALRIPPGLLREHIVVVSPEPSRHTMMALCRHENGMSMLTVGGILGEEPPADSNGMVAFAEEFAPASAVAAIRAAEPVGDISRYRVPSNRWRRYDKMTRFPKGLLVCGDAICSFNPFYGQGMTVAALDAKALRDSLKHGQHELSRRFFRDSAKVVNVAWQMAAGPDLALQRSGSPRPRYWAATCRLTRSTWAAAALVVLMGLPVYLLETGRAGHAVEGARTLAMQFNNLYRERVMAAAESDPFIASRVIRIAGFVDPPTVVMQPSMLRRVAASSRRQPRVPDAPAAEPVR
jgi:2-polyprenyl-6-methoxyphenol hydroxylase-like FAD-dependent oxidoreductase